MPAALIAALTRAAGDRVVSVRVAAVAALDRQGALAAPALVAALSDPAARVRVTAANALLSGGTRYTAFLTQHIPAGDVWARILTLGILARRTPWRWRAALLAAERDGLAHLEHLASVRDMLGCPPSSVGGLLRRDICDEIAEGLNRLGEGLGVTDGADATRIILRGLEAADPRVRAQAQEALEAARSPEVARRVARLMADERGENRAHGAKCAEHLPALTERALVAAAAGAGPWRRALVATTWTEMEPAGDQRTAIPPDGKDAMMLSLVERATLLRGVPPFADLPSDQLRLLAEVTREIEVGEGETLIASGTSGERLYVVITGQIALENARGAHGSVARIGTLGPGAALGEDAVFDGGTHILNATAVTDCRLLALDREVLLALLEEQPLLARALIAWLSARLRETSGQLAERTRSRPRSIINLLDQIGEEGQ
jgi:CRP-like cAMP-binding protein